MKLIKPITVDSTTLTTSNVAETDYATWAVGTTYAVDAYVILNHKVYRSLVGSNIGKNPETEPTYWVYVSVTNRYKMFDLFNSTKTTNATSIDVTITPSLSSGVISGIGLLDISGAQTVQVIITDPTDGTVYNETFVMSDYSNIGDIYNYFFSPILLKTSLVLTGLPNYVNRPIRIIITGSGTVSCGTCILGNLELVGCTVYGASVGITDYSRKTADDFGGYTIVERAFSKKGSFSIVLDTPLVDYTNNLLASLRAQPTLFIGGDSFEGTYIFGFFKDYTINISNPVKSDVTIEIEGLT